MVLDLSVSGDAMPQALRHHRAAGLDFEVRSADELVSASNSSGTTVCCCTPAYEEFLGDAALQKDGVGPPFKVTRRSDSLGFRVQVSDGWKTDSGRGGMVLLPFDVPSPTDQQDFFPQCTEERRSFTHFFLHDAKKESPNIFKRVAVMNCAEYDQRCSPWSEWVQERCS